MSEQYKILSINVSESKGTEKRPVESARFTSRGIDSDAHAGEWHRQVSLLDNESIREFAGRTGIDISPGDFGENLTTGGGDITLLVPGSILRGPDGISLTVTQVGKECHGDDCTIYRKVGKCIMPARGVFCRVTGTGNLHRGDILELSGKEETP